jgi:hypothetical protein
MINCQNCSPPSKPLIPTVEPRPEPLLSELPSPIATISPPRPSRATQIRTILTRPAMSSRPQKIHQSSRKTAGFLTAQEQAVKLLEQADQRYGQEVKRRMENLDQIPQQIQKSSDEILAAFKRHAGDTSETLTRVSTVNLRVAEKLQAENLRVGFKTFLAAILTAAVIGLPAFGWLAWQNSQLRTRADTWRESAERINRYVVETIYPHMNEKERVEANNFYARHRLPTPEDQTRARAE